MKTIIFLFLAIIAIPVNADVDGSLNIIENSVIKASDINAKLNEIKNAIIANGKMNVPEFSTIQSGQPVSKSSIFNELNKITELNLTLTLGSEISSSELNTLFSSTLGLINSYEPEELLSIVGVWRLDEGDGASTVLEFKSDGTYRLISEGTPDQDGWPGEESGTYTWNHIDGAVSIVAIDDGNGVWGLDGETGLVFKNINNEKLELHQDGVYLVDFLPYELPSPLPPLFGDWRNIHDDGFVTLSFREDGTYTHYEEGEEEPPYFYKGSESGTYVWNEFTGEMTPTVLSDNNGKWGFSAPEGIYYFRPQSDGNELFLFIDEIHVGTFVRYVPEEPIEPIALIKNQCSMEYYNSNQLDFTSLFPDLIMSSVTDVKSSPSKGIYSQYGTYGAFATLLTDGTVKVWGNTTNGGNQTQVNALGFSSLNPVKEIFSTNGAFAALLTDGTVKVWGDTKYGGSQVQVNAFGFSSLNPVKEIFSTNGSFAALLTDGTVKVWGNTSSGGDQVQMTALGFSSLNPVKEIYSNYYAFAALLADGTVKVWGNTSSGGDQTQVNGYNFGPLNPVKEIYSNYSAFAALLADGTVKVWGNTNNGGSQTQVNAHNFGVSSHIKYEPEACKIVSCDSALIPSEDGLMCVSN